MGTNCSRVRQGNHGSKHCGTNSPLSQAEEEMVTICIQMGKIWQLLSVREGIELMNASMRGTHNEKMLQSFKWTVTFAVITLCVELLDLGGGMASCGGMGTG